MNDRYDGYAGGDPYELVGYDEFGQPVYRQVPTQQAAQGYDPYGTRPPQQHQGYGYAPYATGTEQPGGPDHTGRPQPPAPADTYAPYGSYAAYGTTTTTSADGRAPHGRAAGGGRQARVAGQTAHIPHQAGPADSTPGHAPGAGLADGGTPAGGESAEQEPHGERDYRTEQFTFVEEPDGDSEDVIDWLKFTENRTERREEARRRARGRITALVVVLALVALGGVGYLWYTSKLPGLSSGTGSGATTTAAVGAQNRDVIVVHLHNTNGGGTSTALLVDNTTIKQGATVLLPNSLALTSDDGTTTTLAKSVADNGSSGTSDAIDSVLGTKTEGTWRLDTPYLENLVDLVGNIEVDTNTEVPNPGAKKEGGGPLVHRGQDQTLSGTMAVAYATYRATGESQDAQLERFGQVMQGVLRKVSSDPQAATITVQTLAQILDPSLTDKDLGAFLAKLAEHAKAGDYKTALLPVQPDGTIGQSATDTVVRTLLGGTVNSPRAGGAVRVGVRAAAGSAAVAEQARVALVNGGYTCVDAGSGPAQATSLVSYADDGDKQNASEVAKTLGLPTSAVQKGMGASNTNVVVVLGKDYKPSS